MSADTEPLDAFAKLPFYAYFLVAGADGSVDREELQEFFSGVQLMGQSEDELLASIFQASKSGFDRFYREAVASAGRGTDDLLSTISAGAAAASERFDAEVSERFRRTVFLLGQMVAEASGDGGDVGDAANISTSEVQAMASLSKALALPG